MILFWANDVSVDCVFKCGLTCGMLSSERVLALIFMIMTDDLPKIVSNLAVLTHREQPHPNIAGTIAPVRSPPAHLSTQGEEATDSQLG